MLDDSVPLERDLSPRMGRDIVAEDAPRSSTLRSVVNAETVGRRSFYRSIGSSSTRASLETSKNYRFSLGVILITSCRRDTISHGFGETKIPENGARQPVFHEAITNVEQTFSAGIYEKSSSTSPTENEKSPRAE